MPGCIFCVENMSRHCFLHCAQAGHCEQHKPKMQCFNFHFEVGSTDLIALTQKQRTMRNSWSLSCYHSSSFPSSHFSYVFLRQLGSSSSIQFLFLWLSRHERIPVQGPATTVAHFSRWDVEILGVPLTERKLEVNPWACRSHVYFALISPNGFILCAKSRFKRFKIEVWAEASV